MTSDDMIPRGVEEGKGLITKYPLLNFRQAPNYLKFISEVISNQNIERTSELKRNNPKGPCACCFVADKIFSPFTRTKGGGGEPKDDMMTRGRGSGYPPKVMSSFMNSPLDK